MRILLVAATEPEVAGVVLAAAQPRCQSGEAHIRRGFRSGHELAVLTTGVGMVATAARCARALARVQYDLALNLGLCGSFDPAIAPGCVVHVVADRIAELGAEDGDEAFLTIHDLRLLDEDEFPFSRGQLMNAKPPAIEALRRLPAVSGVTVNTVHGAERSIADLTRRFSPQVESMEGAAFMYACLAQGVPFAQVRAVSNLVERRNRAAWKIPEAIDALGRAAAEILDEACRPA